MARTKTSYRTNPYMAPRKENSSALRGSVPPAASPASASAVPAVPAVPAVLAVAPAAPAVSAVPGPSSSGTTIERLPDEQGASQCPIGEFDIVSIVGQDFVEVDANKRMEVRNLVVWAPSLVPPADCKWDGPIQWGLPEKYKRFNKAAVDVSNPDLVKPSESPFTCRYCGTGLSTRSSLARHEKSCKFPGSQAHNCHRGEPNECPPQCPGSAPYNPPPDNRIGNKKGKTGRPRGS